MTETFPNINHSNVGFSGLQVQALRNSFVEAGGTNEIDTLNLGASGTAGTLYVFPTTASKGKLKLSATDNTADYQVAITNAAFGQAATLTIPDPGAATAKFALDGYTNVFTAAQQINTLNVGASGTVGAVSLFPTTASKGKWLFSPVDNTGNTTMTLTNTAQGGAYTYTIPDAGASASFVMTQGTQTITGAKTFATGIAFGVGATAIDLDSGTGTCSSNAVTISKQGGVVTTESLNTAGGASQAITITNTLVAAGDLAMVQLAGGTNTTKNITLSAVTTSNTITVTIYNNTAATALNGTIIFNFVTFKA